LYSKLKEEGKKQKNKTKKKQKTKGKKKEEMITTLKIAILF
jgi:hypothetical protein